MDHNTVFGGNPLAVVIRLTVLSIVVGIVLSALGITLDNFFYRLNVLLSRIYELGFNAVDWLLGYLVVGAIVVVPVWLISRLFRGRKGRSNDQRP